MIFKSFTGNDDMPFLQGKRNIGEMFNVDWLNLFKITEYSLGVIDLVYYTWFVCYMPQ